MSRFLFVILLIFVIPLEAKQHVRFTDNHATGFLSMYNPHAGFYAGPAIEFSYCPVLLNAGNTVFLLADFTGRLSGTKSYKSGGAGFTADLELRVYNKRVNRAKCGLSVAYGWNCAVGAMEDQPVVPVWGFDWIRTGVILCDRGAAGRRNRLYYVEFQEWEGQYFVGFGVEFTSVEIAPRLHSRLTYFTNMHKLKKYR